MSVIFSEAAEPAAEAAEPAAEDAAEPAEDAAGDGGKLRNDLCPFLQE